MFVRRAVLLLAASAALVPALAAPAHASCLDDLENTQVLATDTPWSPSPHYNNLSYVQVTGTATVTVYGDDLAGDSVKLATYFAAASQDWAGNVTGATTAFVDCVAG